MNKVKVYTFVGTIKELKERLAERVEKEVLEKYMPYDRAVERAKKQKEIAQENIRKVNEALDEQQKAETMENLKGIVGNIGTLMERIYLAKPEWRPKTDIKRRPFDNDRIDHDFQEEKDREDYDSGRAENEEKL